MSKLKELIEYAGYESRSYSGRGMYGEECLTFSAEDSQVEVILNLIEAIDNPANELSDTLEILRRMRVDQLGLGMVYYFPKIKWGDNWKEEELEEND